MDRPDLRLPNGQELLIREVAKANPRTIVVLMNGGPVETASWEEGVPAVLEAWYGGQVTVALDGHAWERPFSTWDPQRQAWQIAPGQYRLVIGASSRDLRLQGTFQVGA